MKEKTVLLICLFGILLLIGGYVLNLNSKVEEEKRMVCTLKGHFEEFKKYENKEWVNYGSYRKDIIYKVESETEIERGYQLTFQTSEDFELLTCEEVLNQSCTDLDYVKLTKYVENDENRYDFMDMTQKEIIESLESNGYVCEKE